MIPYEIRRLAEHLASGHLDDDERKACRRRLDEIKDYIDAVLAYDQLQKSVAKDMAYTAAGGRP